MREGFPASTHTISVFLFISLELGCFIYNHIIFSIALTKWPTLCKREIKISKCRAYFIIHSSRWWSCINSSRKTLHGMHSLPMRFSLPHLFIMSRIFLHHLILPYPLLHHTLLFMHHNPLTSSHLILILPHHFSTTLHPHIMILENEARN